MALDVPNRAHDPKRRAVVGNYEINYGHNPYTGSPEAWASPINTKATWGQSSAATLSPEFDGSGAETGNKYVSHGSRGTNPHPIKGVRKHIEATLPKMGNK